MPASEIAGRCGVELATVYQVLGTTFYQERNPGLEARMAVEEMLDVFAPHEEDVDDCFTVTVTEKGAIHRVGEADKWKPNSWLVGEFPALRGTETHVKDVVARVIAAAPGPIT